ncbi:MAG: S-adenosylmethionine:tRNA ribosyltransferase-isomerase [Tannerella sp.]|jgi:S-adenosylmethionine:tRNA ribosyltransferase-isomerase|nr:S-adenosylmethionine:tRNA ribosyltransferase-isomerase [Tannerella sp.]
MDLLKSAQNINIEDFDYLLPDERIAKYPLAERDKSKLLVFRDGKISESVFSSLPDYLPESSLLVFNNTRVIRARLLFRKDTGAKIEIFCLEPEAPHDYALVFSSKNECKWKCLVGNLRRWKSGVLRHVLKINSDEVIFTAEMISSSFSGDTHSILFKWDNPEYTFADILEAAGVLPVPPYLHRDTEASDLITYQTIYSKIKGSVAAPTAGLHFSDNVFKGLTNRDIKTEELTLHVGAGTFKPVQTAKIGAHDMHSEHFSVNRSTIENLLENLGNITAVGTTTVRALESLYYIGKSDKISSLNISQWQPYEKEAPEISAEEALQNILKYMCNNNLEKISASTSIIIVPGFRFRLINRFITNFHQPKSTLLLLVSAFVGNDWKTIYNYALGHDFRFLSYGDSSLLFKSETF